MNKHSPINAGDKKKRTSLLERASNNFGFGDISGNTKNAAAPAPLADEIAKMEKRKAAAKASKERGSAATPQVIIQPTIQPVVMPAADAAAVHAEPAKARVTAAERKAGPRLHATSRLPVQKVDRDRLTELGFIVPGGAVNSIAEEFRLIKRQLLRNMNGSPAQAPFARGERILITSANPNEGKTFSAVNLALSMAAEQDHEVLLVDADFAKPSVLSTLGLAGQKGFMDAIADPQCRVEDFIIPTDVPNLSVLPAGNQTSGDAEYLASDRTVEVLDKLTENAPHRIIIFDSPPVLAASAAAVLCAQVGQTVVVVRADKTNETALREAVGLLGACEHLQLLLNAVKFSPSGRRYGTYYGYGE